MTFMQEQIPASTKWSTETVIDLVRRLRNDLIKDFLDERFLRTYLSDHYNIRELSAVRQEFIKSALKDLLIAPVNIAHYQKMIDHIRENDSASLSEGNDKLFYQEIEHILKRHIY
jgi:hypothetical protein